MTFRDLTLAVSPGKTPWRQHVLSSILRCPASNHIPNPTPRGSLHTSLSDFQSRSEKERGFRLTKLDTALSIGPDGPFATRGAGPAVPGLVARHAPFCGVGGGDGAEGREGAEERSGRELHCCLSRELQWRAVGVVDWMKLKYRMIDWG